jgi:hypothetical protein
VDLRSGTDDICEGPRGGRLRRRTYRTVSTAKTNKTMLAMIQIKTPPARGSNQLLICIHSGAAFSLISGVSGEGWLLIAPVGGGVTCMGVGDGGTTVSFNGSAAEPGVGNVSIPANMARNVRLTASA